MPLQKAKFSSLPIPPIFQWQSKVIAPLCSTSSFFLNFDIVKLVPFLNMHGTFAKGRLDTNNQSIILILFVL